MKKAVLIAIFSLMVSGLRAQEAFIGLPRVPTLASFDIKYKLIDTGVTNSKNLRFFHYSISQYSDIYVYFNNEDVCTLCVRGFFNKTMLIAAIEDLNKRFNNIGSYQWVNKDANIQVSLKLGDEGFSILYKKL